MLFVGEQGEYFFFLCLPYHKAGLIRSTFRCVDGLVSNSGQICFAASRVYVQEGIYDKFIAAYRTAFEAKRQVIGDPEAENSQIGPVVDRTQHDRITKIIECAKTEEQGTLLVGGRPISSNVSWHLLREVLGKYRVLNSHSGLFHRASDLPRHQAECINL